MTTSRQRLGEKGELAVTRHVDCPRCGKQRHLTRLRRNFQCADVICKFCGFLAQVKSITTDGAELPNRILGAAWGPQHEQIIAGIFHGLFIAGFSKSGQLSFIDYVPPHIQQANPQVFEPRTPLKSTAKRAGWQGFTYNLGELPAIGIKRVYVRSGK